MRLPYAAKQLIEQVQAEKPKATFEQHDLDGLMVYRTIRFDKRTSKWLAPLVEQFADGDARIAQWSKTDAGYLHITFVSTPNADDRTPFPLRDAATVASSESEPGA